VAHHARVRALQAVLPELPHALVAVTPLPMYSGLDPDRRALLHALVARNAGATAVTTERPSATAGAGVEAVTLRRQVYLPDRGFLPAEQAAPGTGEDLSPDEVRNRLATGDPLPPWYASPAVAAQLHRLHPPRREQGFTVLFTGLSGSGKSTVASLLLTRLLELDDRPALLLDGDVVRTHLSTGLGFSRLDRDTNVRRIGWVAAQVTRAGGSVVAAPIAPYDATRRYVRDTVARSGGFVLVYVDTPLEVCEARDRKGLYAKARAGLIPEFTGISDPYDVPGDAEVVVHTETMSPEQGAQAVIDHLRAAGFLAPG